MRFIVAFALFVFLTSGTVPRSYREQQLKYSRVQEAYGSKEKVVKRTLETNSVSLENLQVYFRAFKEEKVLELWAKNSFDVEFKLIKEYPICDMSGDAGPKRRSRDLQVPEGFYRIIDLNPFSKYYLSLEVNYPNASDSIRGVRGRLGNEIFIHGECISSGCLAITNDRVQELYVYCVEAMNTGQSNIELTIFPARLTEKKYSELMRQYNKNKDYTSLWADLKKGYDLFEQHHQLPMVKFMPDGSHQVSEPLIVRNRMMADSIRRFCSLAPLPARNETNFLKLPEGTVSNYLQSVVF
jgi:murein L,D-transpeptidase YafK